MRPQKYFFSVILMFLFCSVHAGTLIFTGTSGEERIISQVTIESIANGQMVLKLRQGSEVIPLASVKRYYDSNIKVNGDFEDNTAAYTLRISDPEIQTAKNEKRSNRKGRESLVFALEYNLYRAKGSKTTDPVREPYFYLYMLTSEPDGSRRFSMFSYPRDAHISGKRYDEAKMLENVISLERKKLFPEDLNKISHADSPRGSFGSVAVNIPLNRIDSSREILAWHLVVWGKDSILLEKDWKKSSFRLSKNWWQTAGE